MTGDRINSTYWWRIYLNTEHPEYTSPAKDVLIHGYSKEPGRPERIDKLELLQKNCCFLIKRYADKSLWITIHVRKHATCDIRSGGDPAIIMIYPDQRPILTKHMLFSHDNLRTNFSEFINKIYSEHKQGVDIDKYRPGVDKKLTRDDFIDVDKHLFKTEDQLNNYIVRLHKEGFNNTQIEHFYNKYKETYPHLKTK